MNIDNKIHKNKMFALCIFYIATRALHHNTSHNGTAFSNFINQNSYKLTAWPLYTIYIQLQVFNDSKQSYITACNLVPCRASEQD